MFTINYRTGEGDYFGTEEKTLEDAIKFVRKTSGRASVVESDGVCMTQRMSFVDGELIKMEVRIGGFMEQITPIETTRSGNTAR
jgi:hypothetical protein